MSKPAIAEAAPPEAVSPGLATALAVVRDLMGDEPVEEAECRVTARTVQIIARRGGKAVAKHRWEAR